jgi:hypothetical protein
MTVGCRSLQLGFTVFSSTATSAMQSAAAHMHDAVIRCGPVDSRASLRYTQPPRMSLKPQFCSSTHHCRRGTVQRQSLNSRMQASKPLRSKRVASKLEPRFGSATHDFCQAGNSMCLGPKPQCRAAPNLFQQRRRLVKG